MKEIFKDSQINHTQEILKWLIVSKNVDYYQILLKENNAYLDFNVFSGPRWRWCGCTTLVLFHFFLSSAGILCKVFPFWTWRLLLPGNSVAFPVQKEPTVLVAKWWHHIQHATYTFLGGQRSLEKGVKRLKNNQKKIKHIPLLLFLISSLFLLPCQSAPSRDGVLQPGYCESWSPQLDSKSACSAPPVGQQQIQMS